MFKNLSERGKIIISRFYNFILKSKVVNRKTREFIKWMRMKLIYIKTYIVYVHTYSIILTVNNQLEDMTKDSIYNGSEKRDYLSRNKLKNKLKSI